MHETQIQRAWARLSLKWIGQHVHFHALRHTAAMRLYEATKSTLALWTNTLAADDPTELLRSQSVPRLQELSAIVDRYAA